MARRTTLRADDIPLLLPGDDAEQAQMSTVFKKLIETIPVVGTPAAIVNACRAEQKALERDHQFVDFMSSLWIVVRDLEEKVDGWALDSLEKVAESLASSPVKHSEITLVLDSYLGLTTIMSLPKKKVSADQIPQSLIDEYADNLDSEAQATTVINEANRIRRSMGDVGINDSLEIPLRVLGNVERDASAYWFRAFKRARQTDSRMVASLVLAKTPDAYGARAKAAREELLEFLAAPPL